MILMPDPNTANIDPFIEETTLFLHCDVHRAARRARPTTATRARIAKRAEAYLKASGLGDTAFFGPEPEFFIFDSVRGDPTCPAASSRSRPTKLPGPPARSSKAATRATVRPSRAATSRVPPVDSSQDMRSEMSLILNRWASRSKCTTTKWPAPARTKSAPSSPPWSSAPTGPSNLKYVVWNVANTYGKTATFMPKPIVGDNGSGMHVHQSVWKDGKNLFAGDGYAGLSRASRCTTSAASSSTPSALNAITNPGTNSYKRLVPGFEAPVKLAYSATQPLGSIRIPYVANPKGRRIEARFPDPPAQPVPGLRGHADGRPGRRGEQDPPGRSRRPRTCTTCRRKKTRRSRPSATAWTRRWSTWTRTASS